MRPDHTKYPELPHGDASHCGGFEATLNIQNSLSVGDGLELSMRAICDNETDAVNNVCNKALGLLLLTDACQVLLQPAQWIVLGDDIVIVATRLKLIYVQGPWTIGDILMGDVTRLSAIAEQLVPMMY